jgi:hypothetical protein
MQEALDLATVASLRLAPLITIKPMSRIRILFAWLVLAALPLQGFAAASMLLCGTGSRQEAQVQVQVQTTPGAQHDHATHDHEHGVQAQKSADGGKQLPDASHSCGVCGSCCHSAAITETPRLLALAPLPPADAAEPFVRIEPRPSTVPDKPPRA